MTYPPPEGGQPPQYPPAPQPGYGYGGYPQPKTGNGLAIAGLVCGIIGVLIFSVILGPLAIIFGAVALNRANRGASGRGMAIAAIVLGAVDVVIGIVIIALVANGGLVI